MQKEKIDFKVVDKELYLAKRDKFFEIEAPLQQFLMLSGSSDPN